MADCHDVGQRHARHVEPQLARLGQRQVLQVVHQPTEVQHLLVQVPHGARGIRREAVEHGFEAAAQRRQRRAQLVGDIVHQALAQRLLPLQIAGHRIERAAELGHFPAAGRCHAARQVAARQVGRRRPQFRQRPDDAARERPGDRQRQQRHTSPVAASRRRSSEPRNAAALRSRSASGNGTT